jgi:hypothetical protein
LAQNQDNVSEWSDVSTCGIVMTTVEYLHTQKACMLTITPYDVVSQKNDLFYIKSDFFLSQLKGYH